MMVRGDGTRGRGGEGSAGGELGGGGAEAGSGAARPEQGAGRGGRRGGRGIKLYLSHLYSECSQNSSFCPNKLKF